jgi:hypothetical protein
MNYLKKRPMKPMGLHEERVLSGTGDVGVGEADTTHADVVSKAKDDVTREITLVAACSVIMLALLVLQSESDWSPLYHQCRSAKKPSTKPHSIRSTGFMLSAHVAFPPSPRKSSESEHDGTSR